MCIQMTFIYLDPIVILPIHSINFSMGYMVLLICSERTKCKFFVAKNGISFCILSCNVPMSKNSIVFDKTIWNALQFCILGEENRGWIFSFNVVILLSIVSG